MNIRLAEEKDIDSVIKLLTQVLNIHAKIRPDIFIGGTTQPVDFMKKWVWFQKKHRWNLF